MPCASMVIKVTSMARPKSHVAGLVLAGGASRRMGRDKAALTVGGHSLASIMIEKLEKAGGDPVLLSGIGGIEDIYPGRGPLAGMHAALSHIDGAEAMLVVPVDMPGLRISTLQNLGKSPGEAVFFENQSLPLKLALNQRVKDRLETILSDPAADLSIRHFLTGLDSRPLCRDMLGRAELINLNTPQDVTAWEGRNENQT